MKIKEMHNDKQQSELSQVFLIWYKLYYLYGARYLRTLDIISW